MPQAAQTRPQAVGQTRAGRGGGTHRRDLRRPKGPKVSVLACSRSTCMVNSPIRFMALSSSACTGSPLRCLERGVDPADRFLTPLLEPEDLYAQLARQKLHRLVTQKPQNDLTLARHRPSAGQVPAGLPAKPGLGKTWTSQARPHLPQAHQQQLSSQNYRSCSGPPWTLRLSQFCVQGNRVRLTNTFVWVPPSISAMPMLIDPKLGGSFAIKLPSRAYTQFGYALIQIK